MAYIYFFSERFSKPKEATLGYLQITCNKLYLKMEEEGGSIWKYNFGANQFYSNVSGKIEIGNDTIGRFILSHI